ncbi:Uncharacterised protein [Serratia entomophila]|uniref:hypothetical protein n=1 Tax=Serratia entomophila TaxID=42906 RepID=UPI00217C042E|nr:hypothetical protein [Serratia entomophila]CAI0805490.1 Uncharacterised protein [Serratia entomophila]
MTLTPNLRTFVCFVLMALLGGALGLGIYNIEWFRFVMAEVGSIGLLTVVTSFAMGKTK